jgi:tRNA nucleotidyltransferase (CCA-adding enzyme)
MRALVASDELAELAPERVWQELARGLMAPQPSRMLAALRGCGALAQLLPEVDALYGVPQPLAHHREFDTGVHVAQALDYAARRDFPLTVRYAVLLHDLGKALSPPAAWPRHIAHEARGARLAERVSARLRVPLDCRDAARLAARHHGVVHRAGELRPATLLDLLLAADALRRPERLDALLGACEADALSRPGQGTGYAPAQLIQDALAVVRGVDAAAVARRAGTRAGAGPKAAALAIPAAVRAARLAALRTWRRTQAGTPQRDEPPAAGAQIR